MSLQFDDLATAVLAIALLAEPSFAKGSLGREICRAYGYDSGQCKAMKITNLGFLIFLVIYACAKGVKRKATVQDLIKQYRSRIRSDVLTANCERSPTSGRYQGWYTEADRMRHEVKLHLSFAEAFSPNRERIYGYEISGRGEYIHSDDGSRIIEGFVNHTGEVYWVEEGVGVGSSETVTVLTTGRMNVVDNIFIGAWSSSSNARFDFSPGDGRQRRQRDGHFLDGPPDRTYSLILDRQASPMTDVEAQEAGHDGRSEHVLADQNSGAYVKMID